MFRRNICALFVLVGLSAAAAAQPQPVRPELAAADGAMRAGRFEDAARQYEAWLETHPDAKEVLFALGVCKIQLGQAADAITLLRRYVRLAPDSADGHAALGVALLDGAATADAKTELETAISLNRRQANAIEALARIHLVEGNPAKAVAILAAEQAADHAADRRAAEHGDPQRVELRQLFAEALIRSGDSATAASILEKELAAVRRPPVQTYVLAGWARIKSGALARAAEICEQGMRLHPDSEIESVYLSLPGPLLAERTAARLQALSSPPDVAELIALGRVLTDVDPKRQTRANEIARKLLSQAIAMDPDNPSAHYNYGRALSHSDIHGALAAWEKALALGGSDDLRLQVYTQLGKAKDLQSDTRGAEDAFKAALDINRRLPTRVPEAAIEYVRFLQLAGRSSDAERLIDEIVAWNPWAPEARVERARLLAARGRWTQVVSEGEFVLRNAEERKELQRVAHMLLAQAYYRLQQPEKAQVHRAWLEAR